MPDVKTCPHCEYPEPNDWCWAGRELCPLGKPTRAELIGQPPKPLKQVMDQFMAYSIVRFRVKVEVLASIDGLDYGGDDWPQPAAWTGLKRLPWEDWPSRAELEALAERLRP
jgi:hypothetical protein